VALVCGVDGETGKLLQEVHQGVGFAVASELFCL
jgi:hypothetical protein